MKFKRFLFISFLIILFIGCLYKMNQQYDKLARYPYELNEEQRTLVLAHLDTEGINYIVSQQIKPEQFLPFITCEGFDIANTLWYDVAIHAQEATAEYVVSFINHYKMNLEYTTLEDTLHNYTYNVLARFFDEGDGYAPLHTLKLVSNPQQRYLLLRNNETLYNYEAKDLELVNDLPHTGFMDNNDITLHHEAVGPLRELLAAASEINGKEYGNLHIRSGFISYEAQTLLYQQALAEHGEKDAHLYWNPPGRNEEQLGYTLTLGIDEEEAAREDATTPSVEESAQPNVEEQQQVIWLKDNAYKYGFTLRYPKGKEGITQKNYQPFTLRYIGKDLAKYLHDNNLTLEEVNLQDFEE